MAKYKISAALGAFEKGNTMADDNEFTCAACDIAIEDIDGFYCPACGAQLDEEFIRACALVEGVHFTRDGDGRIDSWSHETLRAQYVWLMCHRDEPPETLIPRVRELLEPR